VNHHHQLVFEKVGMKRELGEPLPTLGIMVKTSVRARIWCFFGNSWIWVFENKQFKESLEFKF
jgi:hypothetical protein